MRRQRPNYARILGIALGVSVIVHVAVIGFGRLNFGSRGSTEPTLTLVTLPQPEVEESAVQPASSAPAGGGLAMVSDPTIAPLDVEVEAFDLMEYTEILAEASNSDLSAPLVPRPRITPASAETGLSPIRVSEPICSRIQRHWGT